MSVADSQTSRVLIVGDMEDSGRTLSAVLEEQGFESLAAKDGAAALDMMRAQLPDALLLGVQQCRSRADGALSLLEKMGSSRRIRRLCSDIARVAPTDFTVVITGETGSGKELVARAIHTQSRRTSSELVPVDCGSVPPTLMESELFGYEKGAFTGAARTQIGKFELASGGTLFLDEISNLPLPLQAKLLRALQDKRICRVGGTKLIEVDIRIVAATNQGLASMVRSGAFRRDLYHRLNEFTINVPPLRERQEDIVYLAKRFLDLTNKELNKGVQGISEAAMEMLLRCKWSGNVRELRNVMRRAVLCAETCIEPDDLEIGHSFCEAVSDDCDPGAWCDTDISLKKIVQRAVAQVERTVLARVLKQTGGNKAEAARILRIDYKTVHVKVRQYGINI